MDERYNRIVAIRGDIGYRRHVAYRPYGIESATLAGMSLSPFAVRKASSAMQCNILAVAMGYVTAVILVVLSFGILSRVSPNFVPSTSQNTSLSTTLLLVTLALSLLAAIAGGFVTALLSKSSRIRLAEALGGFMILLGILTMMMEHGTKPLWWHITLFFFLIPSTVSGAWLHAAVTKKHKKW